MEGETEGNGHSRFSFPTEYLMLKKQENVFFLLSIVYTQTRHFMNSYHIYHFLYIKISFSFF